MSIAYFTKSSDCEKVKTETLTATAQNFTEIAGLDSTKYSYYLEVHAIGGVAANVVGALQINSDTTATNYYRQFLDVNNAGLTAGRNNNNFLTTTTAVTETASIFLTITTDASGRGLATGNTPYKEATINFTFVALKTKDALTNSKITSLRFVTDTENGLGIGSTLTLWRMRK